MRDGSQLVGLTFAQGADPAAQIGPPDFDLRQCFGMAPPRDRWVLCLQAALFFALADARAQVRGNGPAKPIKTAVGMLPGARHTEGHLYQPFVPSR